MVYRRLGIFVVALIIIGFIGYNSIQNLDNSDTVLEKPFDLSSDIEVSVKENGVIKEITLEEYVVGVVAGEMPIYFEFEALKAQAVASRTYILKKMSYNKDYITTGTVNDQVYKSLESLKERWGDDYPTYINKLRQAVYDTKDEYMTYNGSIVEALFFSTSNGFTEDSEKYFQFYVPYLRSVEVPWDKEISPKFYSDKTISIEKFKELLGISTTEVSEVVMYDSGRVDYIVIGGKTFSGRTIRKTFALKSSDFRIEVGDEVTFTVEGYGHGVGMSQYGAEGMAQGGYKYNEILEYFYKDINFDKLK
jgi:stage II sporulation protein D